MAAEDFDKRVQDFRNLLSSSECDLEDAANSSYSKSLEKRMEILGRKITRRDDITENRNYEILEEISRKDKQIRENVEKIAHLKEFKSFLELKLKERLQLSKDEENEKIPSFSQEDLLFGLTVTTEFLAKDRLAFKIFFNTDAYAKFEFNTVEKTFQLMELNPLHRNFQSIKQTLVHTNDITGFLAHFREFINKNKTKMR